METMACYDPNLETADTSPPDTDAPRAADLRRMLLVAAEKADASPDASRPVFTWSACAAVSWLDEQIDRILDSAEDIESEADDALRHASMAIAAFRGHLERCLVEARRLGLEAEIEAFDLDVADWLRREERIVRAGLGDRRRPGESYAWPETPLGKLAKQLGRLGSQLRGFASELEAP